MSPSLDVCLDGPNLQSSTAHHARYLHVYYSILCIHVLYCTANDLRLFNRFLHSQPSVHRCILEGVESIKHYFLLVFPAPALYRCFDPYSYRVQVKWTQVKGFPDTMVVWLVGKVVSCSCIASIQLPHTHTQGRPGDNNKMRYGREMIKTGEEEGRQRRAFVGAHETRRFFFIPQNEYLFFFARHRPLPALITSGFWKTINLFVPEWKAVKENDEWKAKARQRKQPIHVAHCSSLNRP